MRSSRERKHKRRAKKQNCYFILCCERGAIQPEKRGSRAGSPCYVKAITAFRFKPMSPHKDVCANAPATGSANVPLADGAQRRPKPAAKIAALPVAAASLFAPTHADITLNRTLASGASGDGRVAPYFLILKSYFLIFSGRSAAYLREARSSAPARRKTPRPWSSSSGRGRAA